MDELKLFRFEGKKPELIMTFNNMGKSKEEEINATKSSLLCQQSDYKITVN